MSNKIEPSIITEQDWLNTDPDLRIEIVDGEFVQPEDEVIVTPLHVVIIGNLYRLLYAFVVQNKMGRVFLDGLKYVLLQEGNKVVIGYVPDLSSVQYDHIPDDFDLTGNFEGVPDLAVEVASPGQSTAKLIEKVGNYLKYGCEEVWLIFPEGSELHRYQQSKIPPRIYRPGQLLDCETLLAGLEIAIDDVFNTES